FWAALLLRPWCSTVAATGQCASAPAGISPATSRRRDSSSSMVPITGPSRAISNPYWPASRNLSVVLRSDTEGAMLAEDHLEADARAECALDGTILPETTSR